MMAATWGKPLPQWDGGRRVSGFSKPKSVRAKAVRMKAPAISYQNIKEQVMAALERMPEAKRASIPAGGTLPEIIAAYALSQAGIPYQAQISTDGGRMRLGGSVVDIKVWLGSRIVIVRVMGDYWHSLPNRKLKDVVQFDRLHKYGYRVADLWEHDLYAAWAAGNIVSFVKDAVMGAI